MQQCPLTTLLPSLPCLAVGTNYIETLRVQVHANCRIRRIYFSDRLYSEEELPPEFKLFLPIQVSPGSSVATGLLQVEWLISGRVGFRWTRTESSWLGQMIRYQMVALMKRQTHRGTRH